MSIFDQDRVGHAICCRFVNTSDPTAKEEYGYVKWTHAMESQIVSSVALYSRRRNAKGKWLIKEVDVLPSQEWIKENIFRTFIMAARE